MEDLFDLGNSKQRNYTEYGTKYMKNDESNMHARWKTPDPGWTKCNVDASLDTKANGILVSSSRMIKEKTLVKRTIL